MKLKLTGNLTTSFAAAALVGLRILSPLIDEGLADHNGYVQDLRGNGVATMPVPVRQDTGGAVFAFDDPITNRRKFSELQTDGPDIEG